MAHKLKRQITLLRSANSLAEGTNNTKTFTRESRQSPINSKSFRNVRTTRTSINQKPGRSTANSPSNSESDTPAGLTPKRSTLNLSLSAQ
ncbi:hypothetical protein PGT21_027436 [Puccinia graminis f. sp. tritici]|nr:hypothetical protein PGT21_027436 [Puccinia graminis f. sp. tritici]